MRLDGLASQAVTITRNRLAVVTHGCEMDRFAAAVLRT